MSFGERYRGLEEKFKKQIDVDNDRWGVGSQFLANIAPDGPVDYVLIAMEPSFGGGSGETPHGDAHSSKNFSGSLQDFILHFCIKEYLCKGERSYYLTDLSKGAMPVRLAETDRQRRYETWFPLLCEELNLVAQTNARIVAIGNEVDGFLRRQNLPRSLAGKIIHYSYRAAGFWRRMPELYPERFEEFLATVCWADMERTIKRVMTDGQMGSAVAKDTLGRLREGSGLTEPRKMLMFTYMMQFESILSSPEP